MIKISTTAYGNNNSYIFDLSTYAEYEIYDDVTDEFARKDTTSDVYVCVYSASENMEMRACGAMSYNPYEDYEDCSNDRPGIIYKSNQKQIIHLYNLIRENGYTHAGLYVESKSDNYSVVRGYYIPDMY